MSLFFFQQRIFLSSSFQKLIAAYPIFSKAWTDSFLFQQKFRLRIKNTKNRSKDDDFQSKMDFFFKNVLFVHFFYPKSQHFRWNCHFWWIIVIRLRKNVQIMLNFRPKKKFSIENALYFTMMTTNDSFLTKKTYLIWNRSFLIKMAIE